MSSIPDGEIDRLREDLRVTRDRLNHLLEGGPVSLFTQDRDLRLTWVQNAPSKRPTYVLLGQSDVDFFEDEEELNFAFSIKQEVMRTGESLRVIAPRTIAGEKRYFDLLLKPTRNAQGEIDGIAGVSYDVTEQRRAELALQEADRRKDEFVALLAHELRGPLAPMRNLLAVMLGPQAPADIRPLVRALDRQVGFMTRLIHDLLDMARITNDKMVLRRRRFDLGALIKLLCDPTRYKTLSAGNPRIRCDVPESPVYIHADLERIGQVLGNLLENARKFTPETGEVCVRLQTQVSGVMVTVTDTGVGIAPGQKELIFERFRQSVDPNDPARDGLGLGLYLSRRLIEMHGGSLTASSPGRHQGSTFTLVLPQGLETGSASEDLSLASQVSEPATAPVPATATATATATAPVPVPVPAAAAATATATATATAMAEPQARRILVVDDHVDTALSMAMLIESWGHEVRVAHDGRSGLALVKSWQPNLVFLDVRMPVMDGLEMTRRIRAEVSIEQPRLIALTGFGQRDDVARSLDAGIDTHLVKPADPVQVRALLDQRL
jgi:signal transduction histidine kinase/CheY-like chemotaxis protein